MILRGIFGVESSHASISTARLQQKSFVFGPTRAALGVAILLALLTMPSRLASGATTCPASLSSINSSHFQFAGSGKTVNSTYAVYLGWFTMGRRSPTLYTTTQYGVMGAYLGSNPGSPTPNVTQMSFQTGGPVGAGSVTDCWPGPVTMAVADVSNGSGRMTTTWNGGCGSPEQLMNLFAPGGTASFGQQVDVRGSNLLVSNGTTATAFTSAGNYAGYFTDSSATYVINATSPSGSASTTPLPAIQTVPQWAKVSRFATLGGSGSGDHDQYLAAVFYTAGSVQVAAIGGDGRLTVLGASASLSSGAPSSASQQVIAYPSGSGYLLYVVVSGGIDIFSFDGIALTRLGTIPNTGSNLYTRLQVPAGSPTPILIAEKKSPPDIDIYAGGFAAGQAGTPALQSSIPAVVNDGYSGFGAYIAPSDPATLYLYRSVASSALFLQTDTFNISCIAAPPSPNPTASFALVNKTAPNRTDKANYLGDTFALADASTAGTGGAITNWYVWSSYNASTSTKTNADIASTSAPAPANLLLPCSSAIVSGGCGYSLSAITGTSIAETFGELVSAGTLNSSAVTRAVTLQVPKTHVAGQNVDGSVKILTGGQLDASPSDGSPAAFTWSFTDASHSGLTTSCASAKCTPPANAAAFSVAADYAGGYQANFVAGTIVFTDVAGSITVPATAYSSQGTMAVTISLQKGSSVTIGAITYMIDGGAATTLSASLSTISNNITGTASIAIPSSLATGQNHTVTFFVNYTGGNLGTSVSFVDSFLFSAVQYNPTISISTTNATPPNNSAFNPFGNVYILTAGNTYYFGDSADFSLPSQSATWDYGDGATASGTTASVLSHAYSAGGTYAVKLTVAGVTTSIGISVSTIAPATLTAGISGTSSPTLGSASTWTASASGGTSPYTYSWSSSDGGSGGGSSFTHTFASSGSASVSLSVHDSAGHSANKGLSVFVSGVGIGSCSPSPCIVISSTPTALTLGTNGSAAGSWTASVAGATNLSINWAISGPDSSTAIGTTLTHTFTKAGTYTLTASGSEIFGTSPVPVKSATKTVTVAGPTCSGNCPPTGQFTIVGASYNQFGNTYSAKAGDVITFTSLDTQNNPVYAWNFGDGTTQTVSTSSITHAFLIGGGFSVSVKVTTAYGTVTSPVAKVSIAGQAFAALIVPNAGHLSKGSSGDAVTALSLFNDSTASITIALDFEPVNASQNLDPTTLAYATSAPGAFTLQPHQGWSSSDVTTGVLQKDGIGTLFIKYTGAAPSAVARLYFSAPGADSPTYGTSLPVYPIGAGGPILSGLSTDPQNIVGLKFDSNFTSGITVVAASPTGGHYDIKLFRDDGTQVGTTLSESIAAYQMIKLGASDFGLATADPGHIYYATVAPSAGTSSASIAIGTVYDNRTKDSLAIPDDTPRQTPAPGNPAIYYLTGVGRTTSGAKTDVYLLNTSAYPVTLNLSFIYRDETKSPPEQTVPANPFSLGGGQAAQISDIITAIFPAISGQAIGNLQILYDPPNDNAPLIIEGRIYSDFGQGSYGMQLPAYDATDGLVPGSLSKIVLAGLHNDFNPAVSPAACSDIVVGAALEIVGTSQTNGSVAASDVIVGSPGAHGTDTFGTVASIDCSSGSLTLTTAGGPVNVTFDSSTSFSNGGYDFISKFGFIALGDNPATVHADAYDQTSGALIWSGDYALNGSAFGHFVYQPTSGDPSTAALGQTAFNLVITATGTGNTPVAAFATIIDERSNDLLFIPGKKP